MLIHAEKRNPKFVGCVFGESEMLGKSPDLFGAVVSKFGTSLQLTGVMKYE